MLENIWQVLSKYVVLRIMKPIELGVRNYQKGILLKYMSQIFSLQTKLNEPNCTFHLWALILNSSEL